MSKLEIEVKKALQEYLPFYEEEKKDILNTEMDGHKVDLCAKPLLRHGRKYTNSENRTVYEFIMFVDGVGVFIPGEWSFNKIHDKLESLVDKIMEAWEYAVYHLTEE